MRKSREANSMELRARRRGFTLMEVLVAAALIGVVMAMAMQAFMGLTRISASTRSQIVAHSEASRGVHALAGLLRRAHVIYFTGRPLSGAQPDPPLARAGAALNPANLQPNGLTGPSASDPETLPIPRQLGANGDAQFQAGTTRYSFAGPPDFDLDSGLQTYNRSKFRFWDWGDAASARTLFNNERLRTNDPRATLAYDRYFSSPLMYIAEAHLATDHDGTTAVNGTTNGTIANMFQPLSWTFHVVYLSPMNVPAGTKPSWTATKRRMDQARRAAGNGAASFWNRSTIPFELRVLTIPGVEADTNGVLRTTNQRILLDGTLPKPPYDYPVGTINYHPVPIPWEPAPPAGAQSKAQSFRSLNTRRLDPLPAPPVAAGGPRVAGHAVPHANYNNIGNDPPTDQVLSRALLNGQRPRDRVLAEYIDPDSVHGTCVRLLNTLGVAPLAADQRENSHAVPAAMGEYRKYLNAYGGEFLYNHYAALLPAPLPPGVSPWDTSRGATIPRRALVSVSTRFRTDSRVEFAFATETIELDLENVIRFQTLNGSMNL